MEAILDMSRERRMELADTYKRLKALTNGETKNGGLFEGFRVEHGYASYKFSGTITDRFVELLGRMPTADEIILLVDNGYSHFGATCKIEGRRFSGRVNTD